MSTCWVAKITTFEAIVLRLQTSTAPVTLQVCSTVEYYLKYELQRSSWFWDMIVQSWSNLTKSYIDTQIWKNWNFKHFLFQKALLAAQTMLKVTLTHLAFFHWVLRKKTFLVFENFNFSAESGAVSQSWFSWNESLSSRIRCFGVPRSAETLRKRLWERSRCVCSD